MALIKSFCNLFPKSFLVLSCNSSNFFLYSVGTHKVSVVFSTALDESLSFIP